jgi:hypothetical protein
MRIRTILSIPALIAFAALAGCVSTWNTTVGPQRAEKIGVSAALPAGWARFNPDPGLVLTKDGLLLQTVRVSRDKYGTKLVNTDRTIAGGTEAQEAAQVMIDAMTADQTRHHLTVIDNRPATVGGHPGFRYEVTYRTVDGLTMHETIYVALTADSYVVVRYTAPDRHYHERNAGEFERIVASLQIDDTLAKKR